MKEEAYLKEYSYHENMIGDFEYIFTSKTQLDSLDIGSLWQNNDFDQYDIIGIDKFTREAKGAVRQHWVCKRNDGKVIKLKAEFSLRDQCQPSGIHAIPLSF